MGWVGTLDDGDGHSTHFWPIRVHQHACPGCGAVELHSIFQLLAFRQGAIVALTAGRVAASPWPLKVGYFGIAAGLLHPGTQQTVTVRT